jgi:ABC-type nitrate/sulfonate/bicarbonate transport system substrate-binding protein
VELFLRSQLIEQSHVRLESFTQDELVAALKNGHVDAAGLWEPLITQLRRESPSLFGKFVFSFYTEFSAVVGRQKMLEAQPDLARSLLRALAWAHREYHRDSKGAQALVDQALRAKGFVVHQETWDRIHVHLGLSATLLAMLNEEADWYQSRNRGERLDFAVMLRGALLREIDPTLVTYQ